MIGRDQTVYVVLVNTNGWSDTVECLESILRSDYPRLRVLVVDNASRDDSISKLVEWARGTRQPAPSADSALKRLSTPPVGKPVQYALLTAAEIDASAHPVDLNTLTFIASPRNLGFAGGNNVALRYLINTQSAGYACLLNNDMVIAPHTVTALVQAFEGDPRLAAVGGLILDYVRPESVQAIGGGRVSHWNGMAEVHGAGLERTDVRNPESLGYISGGCLLTPLEILREIGLMDERYFLYAEDGDWGERMRQCGYRLGCAIDAPVWHKGSRATGERSPFQDYYIVRSSLMFVEKHAPARLPIAALYSIGRCLLPKVARGEWARAQAAVRAYVDYALRRTGPSTNGR